MLRFHQEKIFMGHPLGEGSDWSEIPIDYRKPPFTILSSVYMILQEDLIGNFQQYICCLVSFFTVFGHLNTCAFLSLFHSISIHNSQCLNIQYENSPSYGCVRPFSGDFDCQCQSHTCCTSRWKITQPKSSERWVESIYTMRCYAYPYIFRLVIPLEACSSTSAASATSCFASDSVVSLTDGLTKPIAQLHTSDQIYTAQHFNLTTTHMILMLHQDRRQLSQSPSFLSLASWTFLLLSSTFPHTHHGIRSSTKCDTITSHSDRRSWQQFDLCCCKRCSHRWCSSCHVWQGWDDEFDGDRSEDGDEARIFGTIDWCRYIDGEWCVEQLLCECAQSCFGPLVDGCCSLLWCSGSICVEEWRVRCRGWSSCRSTNDVCDGINVRSFIITYNLKRISHARIVYLKINSKCSTSDLHTLF